MDCELTVGASPSKGGLAFFFAMSDDEYKEILLEIESLWDSSNSSDIERLELLAELVEAHEADLDRIFRIDSCLT